MDNADRRRSGYLNRSGHDTSWMERAACRGLDPDMFFPSNGGPNPDALKVCAACEVRHRCLVYAVEAAETLGTWGGTCQEERTRIIDRRSRKGPRSA